MDKTIKKYRRHGKQYTILCNGEAHWRFGFVRPDMMLIESRRYVGPCDCVEG